jgi:hypothetical protein
MKITFEIRKLVMLKLNVRAHFESQGNVLTNQTLNSKLLFFQLQGLVS